MPSPFPGMDPYLEDPAAWGGVHTALIVAIQEALNRTLPDGYVAGIDEYVWVRAAGDPEPARRIKPDVFIPRPARRGGRAATAVRATTEPTVRGSLPRAVRRRQRYVRITTARGGRLLTAIEVLSPSNKSAGEDREAYLLKRGEYLASVNLIEIDLLRGGDRMPAGHPPAPPTDYTVFLCRAASYPRFDQWAFNVRDPLPTVPVPLGAGDTGTQLDLRACLDRVYDGGRWGTTLDYTLPPEIRLREPDAEWAAELLKKHARKKK